MTVDGPGQQAALFLQGIPFRHDREAVLTPVLDAMVARPDVDPDRVALSTSWTKALPGFSGTGWATRWPPSPHRS